MSGYPQPPEDPDVRNIIDKLANFVARNGPEFEEMTKSKQISNPKFSFLFGGEYHAYYKWKVAAEQGMYGSSPQDQQQQEQQQQQQISSGALIGSEAAAEEDSVLARLEEVRRTQQAALQQSGMIDALEEEFVSTVKPLMDSCTKDAIASGKSWIISHAVTPEDCNKIAHYLMRKTLDTTDSVFSHKLHVIYLINDLMFHCQRKKSSDLHEAIEASIVQIFYNTRSGQSDENKDRLVKVLNIWEGQKYFSEPVLEQIHHVIDKAKDAPAKPPPEKQEEEEEPKQVAWQPAQPAVPEPPPLMQSGNPPPLIPVSPWKPGQSDSDQSATPPSSWQPSNPPPPPVQEVPPWKQQLPDVPPPPWVQQGSQGLPPPPWQPQQQQQQERPPWQPPSNQNPPPPWQQQQQQQKQEPPQWQPPNNQGPLPHPPWQQPQQQQQEPPPWQPPSNQGPPPPWPPPAEGPDEGTQDRKPWQNPDQGAPPWKPGREQDRDTKPWHEERPPWQQGPPSHFRPPPWSVPRHPEPHPHLFDRPPPPDWREGPHPGSGPPIRGPPPSGQPPPLMDAPRGPPLSSDPPHPQPPPPNIPYFDLPAGLMVPLVQLEEHNYKSIDPSLVRLPAPQPPSERLLSAIEEFYEPATEDKPRNEEGWEAKALLNFFDSKLRAQQKSISRGRRRKRSLSRSQSRSRSRSRSRSSSPPYRRSSRSASPRSRSPSPSPRSRRRSRSRSPFIPTVPSRYSPPRRSPSPDRPALGLGASAPDRRVAEENIGHQMLKRMGWEGAGLGSQQQGLQEPVRGGEVRDKMDKYKGVGMEMNTPFDEFRKRKSYVYNQQPPPASQPRH